MDIKRRDMKKKAVKKDDLYVDTGASWSSRVDEESVHCIHVWVEKGETKAYFKLSGQEAQALADDLLLTASDEIRHSKTLENYLVGALRRHKARRREAGRDYWHWEPRDKNAKIPNRTLTAAGRKKIAEAMKKRWAERRAELAKKAKAVKKASVLKQA